MPSKKIIPWTKPTYFINQAARAKANMNKRKARQKSMVKKVLYQQEPYKYDAFTGTAQPSTGWTLISNISNIGYDPSAATNSGLRTTTKILLKNLATRGKISVGTTDGINVVRVALVRGRRAGALNLADVAYGSGNAVDSQFNQKFVEVIYDKTFNLQETEAGAVYPPYKYFDMNTALNKIAKFEEQSAAGVIQPYNNTSYYLIACSDSLLTPHPQIRFSSRISFKELN